MSSVRGLCQPHRAVRLAGAWGGPGSRYILNDLGEISAPAPQRDGEELCGVYGTL